MRLAELAQLLESGSGDGLAVSAEALGQRMVGVAPGWDVLAEGSVCCCGMVVVALPRPVWARRTVVVDGRAHGISVEMRWAHVAPGVCPACLDGEGCQDHSGLMCDEPEAAGCRVCGDAVMVGWGFCRRHAGKMGEGNG